MQGKGNPKWYAPFCHLKMNPHTQYGIPTSNNIGDTLQTQISRKLGHRSKSQWP